MNNNLDLYIIVKVLKAALEGKKIIYLFDSPQIGSKELSYCIEISCENKIKISDYKSQKLLFAIDIEQNYLRKSKLETFFYILNRDYLPFGSIEEIFKNHVDKISEENKPIFDDKNLEAYCKNLVKKFEN